MKIVKSVEAKSTISQEIEKFFADAESKIKLSKRLALGVISGRFWDQKNSMKLTIEICLDTLKITVSFSNKNQEIAERSSDNPDSKKEKSIYKCYRKFPWP